MTLRFGQRNNPNWDGLRVQTLNTIGGMVLDSETGGGGQLNKIAVWHADGSPLAFFDLTESGLTSALAVCMYGDALEIPSAEIGLTSGITLIAGMALIGKGENSILSFSGFSGTAITMAKNTAIWNVGVRQVSNGTTSLGIDGRFLNTVIAPCFVEVSGGSVSNIGVEYGA